MTNGVLMPAALIFRQYARLGAAGKVAGLMQYALDLASVCRPDVTWNKSTRCSFSISLKNSMVSSIVIPPGYVHPH